VGNRQWGRKKIGGKRGGIGEEEFNAEDAKITQRRRAEGIWGVGKRRTCRRRGRHLHGTRLVLFEYAEGHWVAEELASVGGDGGVDHAYGADDGDGEEEDGGESTGEDGADSEDECPEEE